MPLLHVINPSQFIFIEMDSEDFTFFDKLVLRGIQHHENQAFKTFVKSELENFWAQFEPKGMEEQ